ncbi:unnamed protein product [Caenorhabditis angaria]|uniref:F-box domain-containing protein n=1 Tax=Caenorhabditis angaria TaxID=860376 RepID=A0A9P1I721_9PELO|nr:unnamed protein product [Caenorhabditis angaria]
MQSVEKMSIDEVAATHPMHNLPVDCFGPILKHLEREDLQSIRKTNKFFEDIYKMDRKMMAGPECEVEVKLIDNNLTLSIRGRSFNLTPKIVKLEEWNYYFKNAKCQNLSIETNQEISMELLTKLLCCKSIYNCQYNGPKINQEVLEKLSEYVENNIEVKVENWDETNIGTSKTSQIKISENIENLETVVGIMKTVSDLNISMKWTNFENSVNSLMKLKDSQTIPEWQINIEETHAGSPVQIIFEIFENIIYDLFGDEVYCSKEELSNGQMYIIVKS